MSLSLGRLITALFFALLAVGRAPAIAAPQGDMHALADRIAKARTAGQPFTELTLFAPAVGPKHAGILDEETILQPLSARIASLFAEHPEGISIKLSSGAGKSYTLDLLRSYPTGALPDMGVIDADGRHPISYNSGVHYQGALAGESHSLAALSVFSNGELMLLFSNKEGNFVLGRLEDGSDKYILYNERHLKGRIAIPCSAVDRNPDAGERKGAKTAAATLCNKVRLYWEVDSSVYAYKSSSVANTQNFVTGLFNQFQAIYANEQIAVELSSLYIWTTRNDYPSAAGTAGNALFAFRNYWNSLGNSFNGDLAHFITRTTNNNGGTAYTDALCQSPMFSYAYSDILGSYSSIPTFSLDVELTTHETGHNLGSPHTHWCGWMTGSGGTCGAIDNCYTPESSSGCSTCASTFSDTAAVSSWQGTVMSYCYLVTRGINLANGFGPLPGNLIRSNVASRSCLAPTLSVNLAATPVCNNDGSVSLQLAANNFGTAPYSYTWSNNAHTQNLSNLSAAGRYTVMVMDSNGCAQAFSADVPQGSFSGDAITPTLRMPVCCNSYNAPLTLNAAAPKGLSSCQTIYWLRSAAAFANQTEAGAFFDTASATNVLKSTNESSITNNATGASLNVVPEPCSANISRYYTPILVQLPKAADSFSYTTTSSNSYTTFGTQIGAYASLPNQSAGPTACDMQDTPSASTLIVTVSNYTGRPGKMRIIVLDSAGKTIYQSTGNAGDGAYTIPASSISAGFLKGMKIIAMDFNCGISSCTSSQATVVASRRLVYSARTAKAIAGCALSPAIRVDFAPAACTMLEVAAIGNISGCALVPNPASSSASIQFNLRQPAYLEWKISDMSGRTIAYNTAAFDAGHGAIKIDTRQYAKGVYLLSLDDGRANATHLKLIIQ